MATINCHKTITNWWLAKQTKWKFFHSFPMANSSIQKKKKWLKIFFDWNFFSFIQPSFYVIDQNFRFSLPLPSFHFIHWDFTFVYFSLISVWLFCFLFSVCHFQLITWYALFFLLYVIWLTDQFLCLAFFHCIQQLNPLTITMMMMMM